MSNYGTHRVTESYGFSGFANIFQAEVLAILRTGNWYLPTSFPELYLLPSSALKEILELTSFFWMGLFPTPRVPLLWPPFLNKYGICQEPPFFGQLSPFTSSWTVHFFLRLPLWFSHNNHFDLHIRNLSLCLLGGLVTSPRIVRLSDKTRKCEIK